MGFSMRTKSQAGPMKSDTLSVEAVHPFIASSVGECDMSVVFALAPTFFIVRNSVSALLVLTAAFGTYVYVWAYRQQISFTSTFWRNLILGGLAGICGVMGWALDDLKTILAPLTRPANAAQGVPGPAGFPRPSRGSVACLAAADSFLTRGYATYFCWGRFSR